MFRRQQKTLEQIVAPISQVVSNLNDFANYHREVHGDATAQIANLEGVRKNALVQIREATTLSDQYVKLLPIAPKPVAK